MVSDSDLIFRLREILQTSDLNTTSAGAVRRQLESDFGVDLSDRKKFISQQIDEILQGGDVHDGGDDNVDGDDVENDDNGGEHGEDDGDDCGEEEQEDDGGDGGGEEEQEDDDDDNEEDEEESDDDGGSKKKNKKRSKEKEAAPKRKGTGFTRLCSLSPQLQELVGVPEMARTEVVKNLWVYIRANDLQDPNNRRNIKCDEKLRSIFRVDTINMFQMNKALSKHIWPLEPNEDRTFSSSPPAKKQKRQKNEGMDKSKRKENQKKGGTTGFLIPLQLSEPFVKFLGTGETTLSRAEAVKRIWDYIKKNDLQDPSDKRRILCDEKLKELFDIDTFHGFSVSKYLTAHLTKIEQ